MLDEIWANLSCGADMSFRQISLLSANSQPERYLYPASNPKGGVQIVNRVPFSGNPKPMGSRPNETPFLLWQKWSKQSFAYLLKNRLKGSSFFPDDR